MPGLSDSLISMLTVGDMTSRSCKLKCECVEKKVTETQGNKVRRRQIGLHLSIIGESLVCVVQSTPQGILETGEAPLPLWGIVISIKAACVGRTRLPYLSTALSQSS